MRSGARNVKDKGRPGKNGDEDKQREKKFDKKRYRLQKYSNKYKGTVHAVHTNRLSLFNAWFFDISRSVGGEEEEGCATRVLQGPQEGSAEFRGIVVRFKWRVQGCG